MKCCFPAITELKEKGSGGSGNERVIQELIWVKYYVIHVWKCHNETNYFGAFLCKGFDDTGHIHIENKCQICININAHPCPC